MSMKFHHLVLDKNKTRAALNQLMEFQPLFSELEKKTLLHIFQRNM